MAPNPHRGKMRRPGQSRTKRLQIERLLNHVEAIRDEDELEYQIQALVPEAWDTLERDVDVTEPKTKVTLYLDKSVAQFWKAVGQGYHARINRVLATFAQMRIAQVRRLEEMMEDERARVEALREGG